MTKEDIVKEYENHGKIYDLIQETKPLLGKYVKNTKTENNLGVLVGLYYNGYNYTYVFVYAATADEYSYVGMSDVDYVKLATVNEAHWSERDLIDCIPYNIGINVYGYGDSLIKE